MNRSVVYAACIIALLLGIALSLFVIKPAHSKTRVVVQKHTSQPTNWKDIAKIAKKLKM